MPFRSRSDVPLNPFISVSEAIFVMNPREVEYALKHTVLFAGAKGVNYTSFLMCSALRVNCAETCATKPAQTKRLRPSIAYNSHL